MKNTYDYESFGQHFAAGTSTTVPNPFTYTARRDDPESRLMCYRWRQYDMRVGRFGQRDPLPYWVPNPYPYVDSAPVDSVDPHGL